MRSLTYVLIALAGVLALLVACPNPISLTLSRQATDRTPPVISLTSPEDGSSYESTVTLAGTVSDEGGQVSGLTLSVPVAELGISLELDDGNAFSYSFSTAGISRAVVITLQARDWNGNTTELVVTLFNDDAGPGIAILSPEDASTYLSTVEVTGSIQSMPELEELTVSIVALNVVDEAVSPDAEGSFSYTFSTQGISDVIVARFRAMDKNRNVSTADLTLYNDGVGPFVEITEPENMSYYSSVVRVSGRVLDAIAATGTAEVDSASYSVAGTSVSGALTLAVDGTFSFEFQTKDASGVQVIDGPRTIEVTATDHNLNSTTAVITILRASGDNDIASLTVTPANKQVSFAWDPVLHATSYTLHNPRYGEIREGVTSPYVWDGLSNGELYSFQLQAVIAEEVGADAWSDLRDAIPLSTQTLAPWVKEVGYRSITIAWQEIPAASGYVVERKEGDGAWLVRTVASSALLTDTEVSHGTSYSYRVLPIEQSLITSGETAAVPGQYPAAWGAIAGTCDTAGYAYGVAVSGDYAYVADDAAGLRSISVADPASPTQVDYYNTTGYSHGVAVSGTYAYVADLNAGLQIIDVTDPTDVSRVGGYYNASYYAWGVAVSFPYAYLAHGTGGLQIVDVTTATEPDDRGSLAPGGTAYGVAISAPNAYVAAGTAGLHKINVSNVDSLSLVGTYNTSGTAYGVAVSGSYAYVADGSYGLQILNVSAAPSWVGEYLTPGFARGVAVSGSRVYVADDVGGLQVIDVTTPATPALIGTCDTPGAAYGVAITGTHGYVADYDAGLQVIDFTTPSSPTFSGTYATTPSAASAVAVAGDRACVALSAGGFRIVDISTPSAPTLVGSCPTSGAGNQIAVSGTWAFIAAGADYGIQTVDFSTPSAPGRFGNLDTAGNAQGLTVQGPLLYLADGDAGLQIYDVSAPWAPTRVGGYPTTSTAWGVAVQGSLAYVAAGGAGLQVVDVSDPGSPSQVSVTPTPGDAYGVVVAGDYAYVADASQGLQVYDISNPASPAEFGSYLPGGTSYSLQLVGSYVYLATSTGLKIVDVSVPADPTFLIGYTPSGTSYEVAVSGAYAYIPASTAGLEIVSLGGD